MSASPPHSQPKADELRQRIAELRAANDAAPGWGAAVGARHEEIQGLERQLAALQSVSTGTESLLPCPFCGSSNIHDLKNFDWVACQDCGAQIEDGEPSAREIWNRRAPQPASAAQGATDCGIIERCMDMLADVPGATLEDRLTHYIGSFMALQIQAQGISGIAYSAGNCGAWQDISTAPNDSDFRFYGLHVNHKDGSSWFEAHYVAWDDDGNMVLPSGDNFDDWAYSDFEFWAPSPALPSTTLCTPPEGKSHD